MSPPAADPDLMPAAFVGHGSPMNALERNRYTEAWRAFGAAIPRPRAILVISAHWFINATAVTAMAMPRVIHDFYGFPEPLFAFDYPAPGSPELAAAVVETVKPEWVGLDHDSWGLDHGTWSVLAHVVPAADIPVVQLSVNAVQPMEYHFAIGERLAPLRREGVLILGSGNVVHNLRGMDWNQAEAGFDWARDFDDAARTLMQDDPGALGRLLEHEEFARAAPTPDHFLPLAPLAALAAVSGGGADVLVEGYAYGSLSMTSYTVGAGSAGTSVLPDDSRTVVISEPEHLPPPDETNL